MTVNLMAVDEWLTELKEDLEESLFNSPTESLTHALAEIMAVCRLNLLEKAEKEKVELVSLTFREERAWSFSWNKKLSPEEMLFTYSHYLESLSTAERFDLLKIDFQWLRVAGCEEDLQHEGFKLLKSVSHEPAVQLTQKLSENIEYMLKSGSHLKGFSIHYLGEGFSVTLP
ncbi:hypothetical protein [Bdellovibrio reynosensis]|uniref:Uncharacterized protein n=1 Tax=Bdellovibrio reynosensis TaxID=2835041 RepID=A0ABY4CCR2_9BACT|nr:hypothetical protein [Bdellovibrio reynosensis]UOF01667.1 hypothetical protein MNR06_01705 [Bdellovibrio reynosensis]